MAEASTRLTLPRPPYVRPMHACLFNARIMGTPPPQVRPTFLLGGGRVVAAGARTLLRARMGHQVSSGGGSGGSEWARRARSMPARRWGPFPLSYSPHPLTHQHRQRLRRTMGLPPARRQGRRHRPLPAARRHGRPAPRAAAARRSHHPLASRSPRQEPPPHLELDLH